jgi:hypothetical protein
MLEVLDMINESFFSCHYSYIKTTMFENDSMSTQESRRF